MELILEIIMEVILEGCFKAATCKKLPLFVRVTFAILLLVVYISLFGGLLYLGIKTNSLILILLVSIVFILLTTLIIFKLVKKRRK